MQSQSAVRDTVYRIHQGEQNQAINSCPVLTCLLSECSDSGNHFSQKSFFTEKQKNVLYLLL